jgi:carbonic anhydrase
MRILRLASTTLVVSLLLTGCAHTAAPTTVTGQQVEEHGGKHGTEALLLTCMDYRLTDDVERYMSGRGMRDQYDHVVLAGAALGATTDQRPAWGTTFWEHLDVAVQLHSITKVILMDHRDCGAFRVFLGEDFAKDREKETAVHAEALRKLASLIHQKRPELAVELLVMDLDGKVETVSEAR